MPPKQLNPSCATCTEPMRERVCMKPEGKPGKSCPTLTGQEVLAQANQAYSGQGTMHFARQASIQEAQCYANRHQRPYVMQPEKTRVIEIIEFAQRMDYQKIGLAFCIGLSHEAALTSEIFKSHGLTVVSACCKAGRTSKQDFLGLTDQDKIFQDTDEAMCNPIFQAEILAAAGAQLNVALGLCVGHDSLFFQHAKAPTTVLAVKDRVTGHNPLAAIYTSGTYYAKLKKN